MSQELLTIEQVARHLKLHVKTVRNYVRSGKLKATRIGKRYRIARADLEAFTGHAMTEAASARVQPYSHVEVSSIVEIDPISQEAVSRLSNALMGAANSLRPEDGSLRLQTIYQPERDRLKIVASGDPRSCSDLLRMITGFMEA